MNYSTGDNSSASHIDPRIQQFHYWIDLIGWGIINNLIISTLGLVFATYSLLVFCFGQDMNSTTYFYFKVKTIAEIILQGVSVFNTTSSISNISSTRAAQYIFNIVTFLIANIDFIPLCLLELLIVYERIRVLKSKPATSKRASYIYVFICVVIGICALMPGAFPFTIIQTGPNKYAVAFNDPFRYIYLLSMLFVTTFVIALMELVLSFILWQEFKKFLNKKADLGNNLVESRSEVSTETQAERKIRRSQINLTRMVLTTCLFFVTCNLIIFFGTLYINIYYAIVPNPTDVLQVIISNSLKLVANIVGHLCIGFNLFIYLKFNPTFRQSSRILLKKLTCNLI
jgi:hypothetical protein